MIISSQAFSEERRNRHIMHVVICEDESYDRDAVFRAVQNWSYSSGHRDIRCSATASSEDLLERWKKGMHMDLLFLDIEIPGELSGMALAQSIRSSGKPLSIVFVTNYDHYVYEGYAVNALRYLRKPVKESEIFACMDAAYKHFELLTDDKFAIDFADQHFALRRSDILYIEARAHYLIFHLGTIDAMPKLRAKISDALLKLPPEIFVQCHRSFIVNLLYIHRFTKDTVLLSTGQKIPVSQTYFAKLQTAFSRYYQGVKI